MGGEHHLLLPAGGQQVLVEGALRRRDPVQAREIGHVLPGEAQGGAQLKVKKVGLAEVVRAGLGHGGARQPQTGEKPDAQGHDGQNGQKPPKGVPQLPPVVLAPGRTPDHHSISSTGITWSFFFTELMVPERTRMTRSAMAVSAELWVMMTTVMPCSRL